MTLKVWILQVLWIWDDTIWRHMSKVDEWRVSRHLRLYLGSRSEEATLGIVRFEVDLTFIADILLYVVPEEIPWSWWSSLWFHGPLPTPDKGILVIICSQFEVSEHPTLASSVRISRLEWEYLSSFKEVSVEDELAHALLQPNHFTSGFNEQVRDDLDTILANWAVRCNWWYMEVTFSQVSSVGNNDQSPMEGTSIQGCIGHTYHIFIFYSSLLFNGSGDFTI